MASRAMLTSWAAMTVMGLSALSARGDQASLRQCGMRLAQGRVPAGIVASREALSQMAIGPEGAAQGAKETALKEDTASFIARFNAEGRPFRATQVRGVVHIRGDEEPAEVRSALERRIYADVSDTPALAVVTNHVTWAMSGTQPRGIIGVGAQPEPECPTGTRVRVAAGTSAIDALDEIVKQVPGLVWVVTFSSESKDRGMRVGLMCPDGYVGTATITP